ncbi:hypothetical protein SRCM100623_00345 [Acetobacter pasteurianus]|uniref:Uncharacterized protein n=1 Tax=Acetobacter pasteurianus TaxID=438 RepID=A0A1A0DKN4_ACEPA|nr:hypothetical protein SRCM100623_00345 [Acetobacter pasteurianus]
MVTDKPVHPRVCGEHAIQRRTVRIGMGSSPRVRGTPSVLDNGSRVARFIPACAGNTLAYSEIVKGFPVHPRVCGEHEGQAVVSNHVGGSSPRVRGTLRDGKAVASITRFIPACAGNTKTRLIRSRVFSVHPRVCGEHKCCASLCQCTRGSSPRVRGTLAFKKKTWGQKRFIPACAGNTWQPLRHVHLTTVHPRVCGEHKCSRLSICRDNGSSPRVRGTRLTV